MPRPVPGTPAAVCGSLAPPAWLKDALKQNHWPPKMAKQVKMAKRGAAQGLVGSGAGGVLVMGGYEKALRAS